MESWYVASTIVPSQTASDHITVYKLKFNKGIFTKSHSG